METLYAIAFVIIVFCLYFLPTLISAGKKQNTSVFVINLFLGWTLIGWVAALALAAFPMEESK